MRESRSSDFHGPVSSMNSKKMFAKQLKKSMAILTVSEIVLFDSSNSALMPQLKYKEV